MEEPISTLLNFGAIIALWVAVSPLLVSLFKNLGGSWPMWLKKGLAVFMALFGSVAAYAIAADLGTVDYSDWTTFWAPLIIGVAGAFAAQLAIYSGIWKDSKLEAKAAAIGTGS